MPLDTLPDAWQDALRSIRDSPLAYLPIGHVPGPVSLAVELYRGRTLDLWERDGTAYAALSPLGAELLKVEIDERGACDDPALGVEIKREVNTAPLAERKSRPRWEKVELSTWPFDAPRWAYRESERRAPKARKYERERPLIKPERVAAEGDADEPLTVEDDEGNTVTMTLWGLAVKRTKPQRKRKAKKRKAG